MWFLKGRPTKITVRALVSSIQSGYQQTSYRFNIQADEESLHDGKMWVAIAIPWAPHKPDGSFKIVNTDLLSQLEDNNDVQNLSTDDIEIWDRLRSLKTQPNIELVHVQELINWYLDDVGVVSCWVKPDTTYQLNYTHKIAADSCLFLPTRLPIIISARKPEMDYKLWAVNSVCLDLEKQLKREGFNSELQKIVGNQELDLLTFKDWEWDTDTRIHTDNWESSDDDWESSDEETQE